VIDGQAATNAAAGIWVTRKEKHMTAESNEVRRARRRAAEFGWRLTKTHHGGLIIISDKDQIISDEMTPEAVVRLCEQLEEWCE
jgi:hypothetical protein